MGRRVELEGRKTSFPTFAHGEKESRTKRCEKRKKPVVPALKKEGLHRYPGKGTPLTIGRGEKKVFA